MTTLPLGIHDIAPEVYHADPCEEPSLSSSGIAELLEDSTPAHFQAWHPRLNPSPDGEDEEEEKPEKTAQRIGTAAHSLILGAGREILLVKGHDNWRKKEAQEAKKAARAAGQCPLLEKEYARALQMQDAGVRGLVELFGSWPIGLSERALIWQRETAYGTIWCRALSDHVVLDHTAFVGCLDVKTSALRLAESTVARKLEAEHDDIQALWYLEGFRAIFPELADRAEFANFFLNSKRPHDWRFTQVDEEWAARAHWRIERAANLFAKSLYANDWPSWPRPSTTTKGGIPVVRLSAPTYKLSQWLEAELMESE